MKRLVLPAFLATLLFAPVSSRAAEPDVRNYEALLRTHLLTLRNDGRPVATGFDYAAVRARPGAMEVMRTIRRDLLAIPPSRMSAVERLAWAINLYNFLVIDGVLENFNAGGHPPASVRDVPGFFDQPVVQVEGHAYSLNAFERHFLFADYDVRGQAPRPPGLDPRIHFAIVCAARGCPPLAARAYRAATLNDALDRAAVDALATPLHLRTDLKSGRLAISSLFDWYAADFGGRAGVREFLGRYAPPDNRAAIRQRGEGALDGFIPWDWKLNQVGDEFSGGALRSR